MTSSRAIPNGLTKKGWLDRLAITLALYKDYVSIQKGASHLDSSKLAEGLIEDLLTLVSPWGKFKNLNHEYLNYPAIDLISLDEAIGVQVTSSSSLEKVTETIRKFQKLKSPPANLYILMICGRAKAYSTSSIKKSLLTSTIKFDPDENILTLDNLYKWAERSTVDEIERAVQRLESEVSSRAVQLLQRFNASADRVLQLFNAHALSPAKMVELLGLSSPSNVEEIVSAHTLQALLTPDAYNTIATAFHVPKGWLNGEHNHLAEVYDSSRWRASGDVSQIILDLLSLYKNIQFKIVLPMEPDGMDKDGHTPVLVFYQAESKHGKIFGHLGIQPWDVDNYTKAALYLGTILRHLALAERLPLGVSWWQWPRDRILATTTETLLAEAVQSKPRVRIDETRLIDFEAGTWRFSMEPKLDKEFNEVYLPAVRDSVLKGLKLAEYRDILDEFIAEAISRFKLPPPKKRVARVFGREAYAIAKACRGKVCYVDRSGKISNISVSKAQRLMNESPILDDEGHALKMVFVDTRLA